jgi:hypothetical protein
VIASLFLLTEKHEHVAAASEANGPASAAAHVAQAPKK